LRYEWCWVRVSVYLLPSVDFRWRAGGGGYGERTNGRRVEGAECIVLTVVGTNRDAFAGGFVAGIVQGKALDECVDMGHWLASLSIKELGPRYVLCYFTLL